MLNTECHAGRLEIEPTTSNAVRTKFFDRNSISLWSRRQLTFSFSFSIFLTELRRCGRSSWPYRSRAEPMSLALPMCFSSCFSASFSLLSALRLSVWYMWYVFITCSKQQQQQQSISLQKSASECSAVWRRQQVFKEFYIEIQISLLAICLKTQRHLLRLSPVSIRNQLEHCFSNKHQQETNCKAILVSVRHRILQFCVFNAFNRNPLWPFTDWMNQWTNK